MTNTFIYTLGNGWWPYTNITDSQKSPSILKGCLATDPTKFIPLSLFNGSLEKSFYDFYNWKVDAQQNRNGGRKDFIYDIVVSMPRLGIKWENFNFNPMTSQQLTNRNYIRGQFAFFNQNKKHQLFVIDFQNTSYRRYSNAKLLEFEKYLADNGFNLNNFVYLDTDQTWMEDRYAGTKIRLFKYDNADEAGIKDKAFILTRCFMVKDKAFVDEQVARIKSELEADLVDNG